MDVRSRLVDLPSALVERVERTGATRAVGAEHFSPEFQVAFPNSGLFLWHVCGDAILSDANQVLFVRGGEPFRVSEPRPGGYAETIVTPSYQILSDLTETAGFSPERHPLFQARHRRATPAIQKSCAKLLHRAANALEPLVAEEEVVALLRSALEVNGTVRQPSGTTKRLIERTKEFLDAHFAAPLQLGEVARAVGASPAYLTDVFRRFEGTSLQRYVRQLRLARALIELPHTEDITTLALDLGFSSHSHFTLVFRQAFGCTPSEFRRMTRGRQGRQIVDRPRAASEHQDATVA